MTWSLPDTYHLAGNGRGTATLKFYEGRDILELPGRAAIPRRGPGSYSDWSKQDLLKRAKQIGIKGRSALNKKQLANALRNH